MHCTAVVTSRTLDAEVGAQVLLKAECLQRGGAFKIRGATNAVDRAVEGGARSVVTYSSGNHAQAVAIAASAHGLPATVVMPHDAPAQKVAATRGYGAQVVAYDRYRDDREALAREIAERSDGIVVPPFDDPDVIAGQGTVARELASQVGELDVLVVPVGGGGLLAGCVAALSEHPHVRIVGVEPAARTVARRSVARGELVTEPVVSTICDGQQTTRIGRHVLPVLLERGVEIVGASDADVAATLRFLLERCKLLVEPSGACALAAVRAGALGSLAGQRVGVVLSGGNIDRERLRDLLA